MAGCSQALELYPWIHREPQSITTLSRGRGYGEAGGEGLFCSRKISDSLTHRCAVPPLPQAGEGCCELIFRGQAKMYKLQSRAEARRYNEIEIPRASRGICFSFRAKADFSSLRSLGMTGRGDGRSEAFGLIHD